MRPITSKGVSWIARDKSFRVQIKGKYIGQCKTLKKAKRILKHKSPMGKLLDPDGKEMPKGVTYSWRYGYYRVRVFLPCGTVLNAGAKTLKKAKRLLEALENAAELYLTDIR